MYVTHIKDVILPCVPHAAHFDLQSGLSVSLKKF